MVNANFKHPHDTPVSAGLRFATELIAWIAGPWAASLWSSWLVVPTLIILVGLPGVFSTPGDKNKIVVATPGPIRVLIELLLYSVAAIAPWLVWPPLAAAVCTAITIASLAIGLKRFVWLMKSAVPVTILVGLVTATIPASVVTILDWHTNPGGIFHNDSGTDWTIVWETWVSWFGPLIIATTAFVALVLFVLQKLNGTHKT